MNRGLGLGARGWLASLVVCAACTASGACGYALAGRGSFLPGYIQRIGIPPFVNHTTVFNLETLLTQKVRGEFIGRGKYQILPESTNVDALLTGEVSSVSITPVSFTQEQLASRYALTLTARIELRDLRENKVLWENPSVTFRTEYDATTGRGSTDPAAYFQQDANSLERISTEFARTIVSAILEAF